MPTAEKTPADTVVQAGCTWLNADGSTCARTVCARGYCQAHYRSLARRGAFGTTKHRPPLTTANGAARNLAILDEKRKRARAQLVRDAVGYAKDWREASKQAVKSGNHRPAQDALLHAGVIEPIADPRQAGNSVIVRIGVALPHLPALPEGGIVVDSAKPNHVIEGTVESSAEPGSEPAEG